MKIWNKLSIHAKYYLISFVNLGVCWGILTLLQIEFINVIFFLTAFVWHFALLTPDLKEKVMTNHHRLSFLAVVVRVNYYLQIFINTKRFPYVSSFVRALSPIMFTFFLFIMGGTGNILFTLLGSFCFEVVFLIAKKKKEVINLETPPAIPTTEKTFE